MPSNAQLFLLLSPHPTVSRGLSLTQTDWTMYDISRQSIAGYCITKIPDKQRSSAQLLFPCSPTAPFQAVLFFYTMNGLEWTHRRKYFFGGASSTRCGFP
ncbi:hypothetical protein FB45DRAFT_905381 [Roridomyces roridus]|uniref:Uncharacterized protein n=1 Tax=Roridomyces roridus TaxID=1738132 RepID=A0AAD7C5E4_9AGAR|nr:hypothetical protein FB45DRAFT_905381 [Roridomyces roridus]